jgi:thiosulfate/3-mercaptopyruvate sulfurtransferase
LIEVPELRELLERGRPVVVLDVRWRLQGPSARIDYQAGHVPGAVFVDVDRDLAGEPNEHGRHPLPDQAEFESAMRRAGVSIDLPVVCYDLADATSAARAWWLLRFFGHADVSVLDGGYAAWVASGGPSSTDIAKPAAGDFVATPGGMPLLDADEALSVAAEGSLLDARAPERFRGEVEPMDPVAGHIPGAVSAPTDANVADDGRLLSPEQLRAGFARLGVSPEQPVAAYCGSGVTAAQQVLALELAGFRAALYADSWSGWITDPDRPVGTGP